MTETEEIPQQNTETTHVEEKVKKERSEAQKAVLEKARVRGLEVRLQKAKERKEAKERALQEVVEKYKKKEEVAEPEPEVEEVVEPEVEKFEPPPPPPEVQKVVEVEPAAPPKPEFEWRNKRLTYTI